MKWPLALTLASAFAVLVVCWSPSWPWLLACAASLIGALVFDLHAMLNTAELSSRSEPS